MKKISFLIFIVAFTTSCTSTLFSTIDVLRPATISFDKSAKNILILNNTVVQPAIVGHTSQLLGEKKKNLSVNTDSLAIFCLSVVNEEFQKKEFFENTYLQLTSTNTNGSYLIAQPPLSDSLQALQSKYDVDAILSLDKLRVTDKLEEYYDEGIGSYYAILEANYESSWTVSYPKLNKSNSFSFKDTIYWDNESFQRKKALGAIPDRYNALIDGALHIGQTSMKKLVPWWDKEDRYFFSTNHKSMKMGLDSVYTKNWKAAILNWEKGLLKAKPALKAKLMHNMAVAYEIDGDMNKAWEYSQKSVSTYTSSSMVDYSNFFTINQYATQLKNRLAEIDLINKQLGIE
jgi:Family of unknown function (DUF6340)